MEKPQMKQAALQYIDGIANLLADISLAIHAQPELGGHELNAVKLLTDVLYKEGFCIERGIGKFPTAFIARKGSGKVPLAFLAEYDALPVLGHACGHNLIAAMGLGAALALAYAAGEFFETVLIGCPAEETFCAKAAMADEGYFDGFRAILITHPGNQNYVGGTSYASHPIRLTFRGRSAHIAGADRGINALDALLLFFQGLKTLQSQLSEKTVIGGIITQGGIAPNIIPEIAEAKFTVRAMNTAYLEQTVVPMICRIAQGVAQAMDARVELDHYEPLLRELRQDEYLTDLYLKNMAELGEAVYQRKPDEASGSTDVGNVSYRSPTIQPTISVGKGLIAHTGEFAAAAGTQYAQQRLLIGAKAMAATAIDVL